MVVKRKAIARRTRGATHAEEVEKDISEEVIEATSKQIMKKPAAAKWASKKAGMEADDDEGDEEEEKPESKEDAAAQLEKETVVKRTKLLKSMGVQDLKNLLQKNGLETEKVKKA